MLTQMSALKGRHGLIIVTSLLALTASSSVTAQVIEIGDGGVVKTYAGPMVFSADGGVPIVSAPHRSARRKSRVRAVPDHAAISQAADAAALSPELVEAIAWRESGFQPRVVSRAGAVGEMQLMPATAQALGVDPTDTRQNFRGGATYLRRLMVRYDGDLVRTLAAYNAGPKAVDRYGGVPPYKETQAYVAAIMERLSQRATAAGGSAK